MEESSAKCAKPLSELRVISPRIYDVGADVSDIDVSLPLRGKQLSVFKLLEKSSLRADSYAVSTIRKTIYFKTAFLQPIEQ